jgi:integration host factor subunit beta
MTRSDLAEQVANRIKINKKQAEAVIKALVDSISDSLSDGGKVEIRGFGSFRIRERNARTARNPKSGEIVEVPAKKVPFFKAGKELKAMVDAGGMELS